MIKVKESKLITPKMILKKLKKKNKKEVETETSEVEVNLK